MLHIFGEKVQTKDANITHTQTYISINLSSKALINYLLTRYAVQRAFNKAAQEGNNDTIDRLSRKYELIPHQSAINNAAWAGQNATIDHLVTQYGLQPNTYTLGYAAKSKKDQTIRHLGITYQLRTDDLKKAAQHKNDPIHRVDGVNAFMIPLNKSQAQRLGSNTLQLTIDDDHLKSFLYYFLQPAQKKPLAWNNYRTLQLTCSYRAFDDPDVDIYLLVDTYEAFSLTYAALAESLATFFEASIHQLAHSRGGTNLAQRNDPINWKERKNYSFDLTLSKPQPQPLQAKKAKKVKEEKLSAAQSPPQDQPSSEKTNSKDLIDHPKNTENINQPTSPNQ